MGIEVQNFEKTSKEESIKKLKPWERKNLGKTPLTLKNFGNMKIFYH